MSKLIITTQVLENYGAHDWDGEGECPSYWKAKGGNEYVVKNVDECDMVETIVARVGWKIEQDNEYFREYILNWQLVADDFLTEFEQSQLRWEGRILYPAQELEIA